MRKNSLTAIALLLLALRIVRFARVFRSIARLRGLRLVRILGSINRGMKADAMKQVRVTDDEILAAIRQHGIGNLEQVAAVVMETDGSLSVIGRDGKNSLSALAGVSGIQEEN